MSRSVWSDESLRGRAKKLGYWPCKVIGHQHDIWFLVKARPITQSVFVGDAGDEFIPLGPLGSPDAVSAAINVLEARSN